MSTSSDAHNTVREYVEKSRDPLGSLRELREAIEIVAAEEVQRARNLGAPWTIISKRLGIARPTAVARYGD